MNRKILVAASALALALLPAFSKADETPIGDMRWRDLGPAITEGRASAVVGSDTNALLYYVGTAGGGAWKSLDGGQSWQNITDRIHVASVGTIALNVHDDNDVWLGAGETNPRNDVIPESGLYHSTDGGRSWKHVTALPDSAEGISKILLDPKDPKHIIVGVLGNAFGASTDRGVYVSFDGGVTFAKSLYTSAQTGVSDMAMDPKDPDHILAGMWHLERRPWEMTSGGGNDDGLYASTDGGKTWKQVTGGGFPKAPLGRIGLAFAPSQPTRIFALVESKDGVVWRSDDSGATWTMTSKDSVANQRPFYFSHIRVSPAAPNTVYGLSELLATSYDGGKKFNLSAFGVHPDLHDMWISADGNRMALAGDGGIATSVNSGSSWSNLANLPVTEVYRVGLSNTVPYYVCGGFQDNNGFCGPAFSGESAITNRDWWSVIGGDGEWTVPDPLNQDVVWADAENGEVMATNFVTHDAPNVKPYRGTAAEEFVLADSKYRFDWESPIAFAEYDPHLAFIGANVVWQTADRGKHWKVISPDLTRNDKSKQQGDKDSVVKDESGAEDYGTILDIETSRRHKGEIWTGSDDGLVYLTLDGGKHWRNVTPSDLPADSVIETVAPSMLEDGVAYVSADRHGMNDRNAYLYVTTDFGAHWTKITSGIPAGQYVHAVRPDIRNRSMVYAGTNRGIFISCDRGAHWQSFQNNLPTVEVRDIRMQPKFDDLVIATHGRGMWVMDDMRIAQLSGCTVPKSPIVLGPRPIIALNGFENDEGNYLRFSAPQPGGGIFGGPNTAKIYYWLPTEAKKRPTIDVYDAKGHLLRHIEGQHDVFVGGPNDRSYWIANSDGKNEFLYSMGITGPVRYTAAPYFFRGPDEGPALPPGHYTLAMHIDGKTYKVPLVKIADPKSTTTQAEYEAAFAQERRAFDLLSRTDVMLNELDRVKTELSDQKKTLKTGDPNIAKIQGMIDATDAEVGTLTASYTNFEDFIQKPGQFREDIFTLMGQEPLAQASLNLYARLEREYAGKVAKYDAWRTKVAAFNTTLKAAGCKAVAVPQAAATKPTPLSPIATH